MDRRKLGILVETVCHRFDVGTKRKDLDEKVRNVMVRLSKTIERFNEEN